MAGQYQEVFKVWCILQDEDFTNKDYFNEKQSLRSCDISLKCGVYGVYSYFQELKQVLDIMKLEGTSHSFKENQPMYRRRNFLKENFNENSRK